MSSASTSSLARVLGLVNMVDTCIPPLISAAGRSCCERWSDACLDVCPAVPSARCGVFFDDTLQC